MGAFAWRIRVTIRAVADTHAVLWYLYDDPRLSRAAADLMQRAEETGDQIAVSSIALVETVYLIEKGRLDAAVFERILAALDLPAATLVEVPVDQHIVLAMRRTDRTEVPDLPDRIVAATALHLDVPVISRDRKIRASTVMSIW